MSIAISGEKMVATADVNVKMSHPITVGQMKTDGRNKGYPRYHL
jgi:hypothetical protein